MSACPIDYFSLAVTPLFDRFEDIGYSSSKRVSKRYKEKLLKNQQKGIDTAIKNRIEKLICEIIEENFILNFRNKSINVNDYIDE